MPTPAEIRARLAAATQGPRETRQFDESQVIVLAGQPRMTLIANHTGPKREADAELFLHAPSDLGFLLAENEQLKAQVLLQRARADRFEVDALSAEAIVSAAQALSDKIAEVHESDNYRRVWMLAHIHGETYQGPTYEAELKALKLALETPRAGTGETR